MGNKRHTELVTKYFNKVAKKGGRNKGSCSWDVTNMSCDDVALYSYSTPLLIRMERETNKYSNCEWYLHNTTPYSSFTSKHQNTIYWSDGYKENLCIDFNLSRLMSEYKGFQSGKHLPKIDLVYYKEGTSKTYYKDSNPLLCDMLPEIVDDQTLIHKDKNSCFVSIPELFIFDYFKQRHVMYSGNLVVMDESVIDSDSFLSSYLPLEVVEERTKLSTLIFYDSIVLIKRDVDTIKVTKNYTVNANHEEANYNQIRFEKSFVSGSNVYVTGSMRAITNAQPTRGHLIKSLDGWYQLTYTREVKRYA